MRPITAISRRAARLSVFCAAGRKILLPVTGKDISEIGTTEQECAILLSFSGASCSMIGIMRNPLAR
jgi:hypothetical protein